MGINIRQWKLSDKNALILLANNKRIWDDLRDAFPNPFTSKDALDWLRLRAHVDPFKHFAIDLDGLLVGGISIIKKTDISRCTAELGYWIGEPFWGRGLASEAVRILIPLAFEKEPGLHRVFAEVFSDNKASQRVLEKNGFYLEALRKNAVIKNGTVKDDTVWVRLRP